MNPKDKSEYDKLLVLRPLKAPSGFVVTPIHYSFDPEKTDEWAAGARKSYDRDEDWRREMELDLTAQLGTAAYQSFSYPLHTRKELKYNSNLPLCLACDFNVDPMAWLICQIRGGLLLVLDEIVVGPTSIPDQVEEFRNRYPDHYAELHIYGDTNGLTRTGQTEKSDYDLMRVYLQNYPSKIVMKVPRKSPRSRDRINSLNHKLKGHESKPGIIISTQCKNLIADLQEVVLRPDGKDVMKTYKLDDPYAARTHASDALGYLVHREWPIIKEALALRAKEGHRKPLQHGKLLGEL